MMTVYYYFCAGQDGHAVDSLDPVVREDVEQLLAWNLEEIRKRYGDFVSFIHDSLMEKDITVESFRVFLMSRPALESDDNDEQHKLLVCIREKLKQAPTVNKLFEVLMEDYGSFINYEIFQNILDKYKIKDEHNTGVLNYPEHLKAYFDKHKLSEFLQINRGLEKITDPSKELILKFNIKLSERVTKVLALKKSIAKILKLKSSALRLVGIKEGCIIVTFLIPDFLADPTPMQIQEFKRLPVMWLCCGDHGFLFEVSSSSLGKFVCNIDNESDGSYTSATGTSVILANQTSVYFSMNDAFKEPLSAPCF